MSGANGAKGSLEGWSRLLYKVYNKMTGFCRTYCELGGHCECRAYMMPQGASPARGSFAFCCVRLSRGALTTISLGTPSTRMTVYSQ